MDAGRQQRGLVIAATMKLTRQADFWKVPSQSGSGTRYTVRPERGTAQTS